MGVVFLNNIATKALVGVHYHKDIGTRQEFIEQLIDLSSVLIGKSVKGQHHQNIKENVTIHE